MIWHFPIAFYLWIAAAVAVAICLIPNLLSRIASSKFSWFAIAAIFVAGTILLPSENHLMGDGLTHIGNPGRIASATEPFDLFVHYVAYQIAGSQLWGYRAVAILAGVLYLLGITMLLRRASGALEKAIIALAFLATGTLQFYFGYVESYTLVNLFILYFIVFSLRDIENGRITFLPLIFFGLALISHFSAVALLPSVILLYREKLGKLVWVLGGTVVLAGVLVSIKVNIFQIIVPFWPTSFSSYWVLSGDHLIDFVNILLLSGPAFFLILARKRSDRGQTVILAALLGCLAFSFLVDPKIGAFRDWDLLSIFAVPMAALVALRAPRHPITVVLLAVIIILRVVPWLQFNSQLRSDEIKAEVLSDPHYGAGYDNGQRLESWGFLLYSAGDKAGARDAWQKRLEIKPDDKNTVEMLAPLQIQFKDYDRAYQNYVLLHESKPDDIDYVYNVAYSAFASGRLPEALEHLNQVPQEKRTDPRLMSLFAALLAAQGQHQQAIGFMKSLPQLVGDTPVLLALARSAMALNEYETAWLLVNKAREYDSANVVLDSLHLYLEHNWR